MLLSPVCDLHVALERAPWYFYNMVVSALCEVQYAKRERAKGEGDERRKWGNCSLID